MTTKESLLKKLTDDEHTQNLKRYTDSIFIISRVCGLDIRDTSSLDNATLFDMGRGTIEAMSEKECRIMYNYFIGKDIIINGVCNEKMSKCFGGKL